MALQKSSTTAAIEHIAMHELEERKQRRRGKQRHADSPAREVKGLLVLSFSILLI